jgi:hypothetical protein
MGTRELLEVVKQKVGDRGTAKLVIEGRSDDLKYTISVNGEFFEINFYKNGYRLKTAYSNQIVDENFCTDLKLYQDILDLLQKGE